MSNNEARRHHYVPQFFLRNFAVDPERTKINTVMKNGSLAIWGERSIKSLGFETDLYVCIRRGVPISVETVIGRRIETPISQSDTWAKIESGRTDLLDRSDKPVIFALMRHLEARTPHYLNTQRELANLAEDPAAPIKFSEEERAYYSWLRKNPDAIEKNFQFMASSLDWIQPNYSSACISIYRSPIPLYSSSTPALAIPIAPHPALRLPVPGMMPFQLILTLNRTTIAALVSADFEDAFENHEISAEVAFGFNRRFVAQFFYFRDVRHLITDCTNLAEDMEWASYDFVSQNDRKIIYQRRDPLDHSS